MKKLLLLLLAATAVLCGVLVFNAIMLKPSGIEFPGTIECSVNNSAIIRFAEAIRIPTISYDDTALFDSVPFIRLAKLLTLHYPLMNTIPEKEVVNSYGLLYRWKGKEDIALRAAGQSEGMVKKPVLLLAHTDVVPVEEETISQWTHLPFSGNIDDSSIYGRGSLDDKVSVMAICEAVEKLLAEGFVPEQTIYIAFGFDEEIGGKRGAQQIAKLLNERGVKVEFTLDEGMAVTERVVPGIEKDVALIGIAEKGYLSLELSVNVEGGHSSMPEKETAIGLLSEALVKIQHYPFPPKIIPPVKQMLLAIGAEMSFAKRIIFSNLWLFEPLIISEFEKSPSANASVRSISVPTVLRSGIKENLIPAEGKALLNIRILPGELSEDVIAYIKSVISDERISIRPLGWSNEASAVSGTESGGYTAIARSIKNVFPDAVVAPSLVIGGTDSRHYRGISENIYRFLPVRVNKEDLKRIHGINERISIENYKECIRFYYILVKNL